MMSKYDITYHIITDITFRFILLLSITKSEWAERNTAHKYVTKTFQLEVIKWN